MADANLKVKNYDGDAKYLKESGTGTDVDPHIPNVRLDANDPAVVALQLLDNSVDGNYLNVNVNVAGTDAAGGAGAVTAQTLRVTHASDDPVTTAIQLLDNSVDGNYLNVNMNVAGTDVAANAGAASAQTLRVIAASDSPEVTALTRAVLEGGLTELVGINEQVDQNDYSGSINVALGATYSGEITSVMFYATEDGTGAVQDSAGILYVFDADPTISSGDTSMTAAERVTVLGKLVVSASDWDTDVNGGTAYFPTAIPFHALSTLYFAWKHTDATALNDGAGDDEQLEFNFWYRRDS